MTIDASTGVSTTACQACPQCGATFRIAWARCPRDGASLVPCIHDPMLGRVLDGKYRLVATIGSGATAAVYRADHVVLDRPLAVKVLFGEVAADAKMRRRFIKEARSASCLEHPNVVTVHDFGCPANAPPYMVMDYAGGVSLDTIARCAPIATDRAVALGIGICRGLAHTHAAGLVHRDIKPGNIRVVDRDGVEVPRILDYGLALAVDAPDGERITESGVIHGTPLYMAPEQARGRPVDERTDLYSLGIVLYELLAGTAPFSGSSLEVVRRHIQEVPPPLRASNALVGPELDAVVMRLLAKDPADRFVSAAETADALSALMAGPGAAMLCTTAPTESMPLLAQAAPRVPADSVRLAPVRPPARWPVRVAVAAVAAAAVATATVFALDSRGLDALSFAVPPPPPQQQPPPRPAAAAPRASAPQPARLPAVEIPAVIEPEELDVASVARSQKPPAAPPVDAAAAPPVAPPAPPVAPPAPPVAPPAPPVAPPAPPARARERDARPVAVPAANDGRRLHPAATPATVRATPPSATELTALYRRVGAALEVAARGPRAELAARLRRRYFDCGYAEALRDPARRAAAIDRLRAIERALDRAASHAR